MEVPAKTIYSSRKGDSGIVVWAIQRALNSVGYKIVEDGAFGPLTEGAVRSYQQRKTLIADGIFGPASSRTMAVDLQRRVSAVVPNGLIRGVIDGESGNAIGAVNWGSPGGVDCGYLQRRVYDADLGDEAVIKRAFDGLYQMDLLSRSVKERHDAFYGRTGAKTHESAWRLAVLNHNYPAAAVRIADVGIGGLSSYWTTEQSWVVTISEDADGNRVPVKFPDGTEVRTPLAWCRRYSLGDLSHDEPGQMVRFVDWTSV